MARKYVILTSAEAANINYDQVCETSEDTLRWNNDNTKTFVKWDGDTTPDVCSGKTVLSKSEILVMLNDSEGEWVPAEDSGAPWE